MTTVEFGTGVDGFFLFNGSERSRSIMPSYGPRGAVIERDAHPGNGLSRDRSNLLRRGHLDPHRTVPLN